FALSGSLLFLLPTTPFNQQLWWSITTYSGIPVFLAFAWSVFRTRRWLVGPVSTLTLAMTLLPSLYFYSKFAYYQVGLVPVQVSRSNMTAYRDDLHERLANLRMDSRLANRTMGEIQLGGHAPHNPNGVFVPEVNEFVHSARVVGGLVRANKSGGQ